MNFRKSETYNSQRPLEEEVCGGFVFIRKNIKSEEVTDGDETRTKWIYDEAVISTDAYAIYKEFSERESELEGCILELAEIIGG